MIYNSNIVVPMTCPITFVQGKVNFDIYKNKFIQPFGDTDNIHIQFLSTQNIETTFYLRCYSARFDIKLSEVVFIKSTLLAGSYYYWDAWISCSNIKNDISIKGINYLDNYVYFKIETASEIYMDSYPILIGSNDETKSIMYHNTRNDFNTVFGAWSFNNAFVWRFYGGFAPGHFKPGGQHEIFTNQKNEPTVVRAMPMSTYTLTIDSISDSELEKLSAILMCDTLMIDGMIYVRSGDIQTTINNELWNVTIDMVPATNRMAQNMEGAVLLITQDGTPITNENDKILTISPTE